MLHAHAEDAAQWQQRLTEVYHKLQQHLQRIDRNVKVEDIHQARVTLRRLLALLSFLVEKKGDATDELRKAVKALQKSMAEVRDADVLEEQARDALGQDAEHSEQLQAFWSVLHGLQRIAREKLVLALPNFWNEALAKELESFIHGEMHRQISGERIVARFQAMEAKYEKRKTRFAARIQKLGKQDPRTVEALHEVRLAAKALRYAYAHLDFTLDDSPKPLEKKYKKVQRKFGVINDLHNLGVALAEIKLHYPYATNSTLFITLQERIEKRLTQEIEEAEA